MKQILMIMLVMLPMMLFSSCSKDDKTSIDPELVGSWEAFTTIEGKYVREVITFGANGSYKGEDFLVESGDRTFKQDDTYYIEGNKIYFAKISGYMEYSISNNTLTLTGQKTYTYTRVK